MFRRKIENRRPVNSLSTRFCLLLVFSCLQIPAVLCTSVSLQPLLDPSPISSYSAAADQIEEVWEIPTLEDNNNDEYYRFGLSGHAGLFRTLNWTSEELKHVSLWHAQADYQKCIEVVEKKLSNNHFVHPVTRGILLNFIHKFRPPQVVKDLLNYKEKHQIKNYHHARNVEKILEIFSGRISQLDELSREQVIEYLGSVIQDTSTLSGSEDETTSKENND